MRTLLVVLALGVNVPSLASDNNDSIQNETLPPNIISLEKGLANLCDILRQSFELNVPALEQSDYVAQAIEDRITSKDTKSLFSAIFLVDEKERYPLFVQSVEKQINKPWSCSPLKKYLSH